MSKTLFMDLDDTLIVTKSGKTFPESKDDWKVKEGVVNAIRNYDPSRIHIISNQGGISKGFITVEEFQEKLEAVKACLYEETGITISSAFCTSLDKNDPRRKPNAGMIEEYFRNRVIKSFSDFMMVGDASGLPGNFSDSDKKCAENAGIKYMDINEFIECYKQ